MTTADIKTLKKLAKACREAGIRTFKGNGMEFTLDDLPQAVAPKQAATATETHSDTTIDTTELSDSELLFWSAGGPATGLDGETN